MFYVDVQRETVVQELKEIKLLLTSFIQRKYKNCITKIGFSTQKELFNIFNKMFNSKKGFFGKPIVRKILSCFWLSIREVFLAIRINQQAKQVLPINKLSSNMETVLKNNFYLRLELAARGRQIHEPFTV